MATCRNASVYIPPEGSRNYNDLNMKKYFEIAADLDVCGGDLNFRGTREDWNIIGDDINDVEVPLNFGGWQWESTKRERICCGLGRATCGQSAPGLWRTWPSASIGSRTRATSSTTCSSTARHSAAASPRPRRRPRSARTTCR